MRPRYLELAKYLNNTAKVHVDGTDLSDTSALMHSVGTKSYFDPEFVQLMFDAGALINRRNRFGCIAAQDIVMIHPACPVHEIKVA